MKVRSNSFQHNGEIPTEFAFGKFSESTHIELSSNKNPHISWSDLPDGTKSLALICHDPDVPSKADDVNQEGRTVSASLPRTDFYHWVLVDIYPERKEIVEGEYSEEITARGKSGPAAAHGTRHGVNNYTQWFDGDKDMSGTYFGYDGPCPPWNDEIIHHYHFTLYALDLENCNVEGEFTGPDAIQAIEGHVLDQAVVIGCYSINPNAK